MIFVDIRKSIVFPCFCFYFKFAEAQRKIQKKSDCFQQILINTPTIQLKEELGKLQSLLLALMDKQHSQTDQIEDQAYITSLVLEKELKSIMPILRNMALECTVCMNCPVERLLKKLADTFGLNWIQAHFFVYLVRESKWNINHPIICAHSASVQDIFCLTLGQASFQRLILYLSLALYTTKEALGSSSELYMSRAMAVCQTFPAALKSWSRENSHLISIINPKSINLLYRSANSKKSANALNYQAVVDQILDMALPYSLTRSNEKLQTRNALEKVSQSQYFFQGAACKSKRELISEPQFILPFLIEVKKQQQGSTNDDYFVDNGAHLDEFGFQIQGYKVPQGVTEVLPPGEDEQMEQYDLKMYDQQSNEVIYLIHNRVEQDEFFEKEHHWLP